MDVIINDKTKVFFGGSYRENWHEDYRLTIEYSNRRCVEAVFEDGRWRPCGGDSELSARLLSSDCPKLTQIYFQAAAACGAAVSGCLSAGLDPTRIWERFHCNGNSLAAPELMRMLMDDCGLSLVTAYRATAKCCDELFAKDILPTDLYRIQPRTASVVGLLRQAASTAVAVMHDSRLPVYRSIFGAVRCGDRLRLAFRVLGGRIESARLLLWGDSLKKECPMERHGNLYTADVVIPDKPCALWYCFYIETEGSAHWLCPDGSGYTGRICGKQENGFRLTAFSRDFDTPAWFRRSVMYQIFPDRFGFSEDDTAAKGVEYHRALGQTPELHSNIDEPIRWQARSFESAYSPDDFYGGTFKGIEGRLPYLKELGIGCIYLNPIVEARSNHRYDTSDYHRPDPILGSMEDFRRLCSAAQEQGIRIILDGVYSHTGADSRYFDRYGHYGEKGACSGRTSQYYDWYDFHSFPDDYRCWWGFKDLPEVNETNAVWQRDVISGDDSVVKLWLKEGAAGWRLDVADELPDEVLNMIRSAAKSVKSDAPIIGEVWEDAVIKESYGSRRKYALGLSLDSVMNYPFRSAAIDFAAGRIDAYTLRDFLISQQLNYPKPFYYSLMNLLGSHDVERLRTALALDKDVHSMSREEQAAFSIDPETLKKATELEKLCACLQFSIPGVPSIYYGDEQGMCGMRDPFNRMPFKEGESELHDYYARLSALRRAAPALSTGETVFMAASRDVLLVLRFITDGRDTFGLEADNGVYLAAINRGGHDVKYTADCSAAGCGEQTGTVRAMSAKIVRLDGSSSENCIS